MNISRIAIFMLVGVAASALGACGRRGALEPPPHTQQGREWERRAGGNGGITQTRAETPVQGGVRRALEDDRANAGTVDIDGELERKRVEGQPALPVDPTAAPDGVPGTGLGTGRRRPPGIVPPKRSLLIDGLLD